MKNVYRADVREMLNVAKDLEEFCDSEALPQDIAFALNLCVDEMFTNVASYAYDGDKDGKVELEVLIQDGFLKTYIRDSGKPFNPRRLPSQKKYGRTLLQKNRRNKRTYVCKKAPTTCLK